MGIFGSPHEQSPQDRIDLEDLRSRVQALEAAVGQLRAQQALAGGGVPYGAPMPSSPPAAPGTVPVEPDWMAEVRALKAQDKVINAIKLYREHTRVGLKEAKDIVEAL